jgi:hypothetical protein
MPIVYRQEFEVRGEGDFPFDMLRYDRCWPAREGEDTAYMAKAHYQREKLPLRTIKVVRYVFHRQEMPTSDRWKSFWWEVVEGSVKTEKL